MSATFLDASEVARILGTSRQLVAELAATAIDFPPAIDERSGGGRRWDRRAIERWAASQPDLAWGWNRPQLPEPGGLTQRTHQILNIAAREAKELNHDFIGDAHLLLALLNPDCPGAAPKALESCGLGLDELRESVVEKLGRPDVPPRHGQMHHRGTHDLLERANLKAFELRDEEVSSEHVLLALTDAWEKSPAHSFLVERRLDRAEVAQRVIALTESGSGGARSSPPATVARQQVHAAEVARMLGVGRARVAELAASADFPPAEQSPSGYRRWSRRAIIQWAAAHPERGPLREPLEPIDPGGMAPKLDQIFRLASMQAEELNHGWVGRDHLLLALLHPECPGVAKEALESFGVSLAGIRQAWVESMGDPFEPHDRSLAVPPATNHVLERARLNATELEDDEVLGEHVLLALTDDWPGSAPAGLIAERGGDAASVRKRLVSASDGMLPAPDPPAPRWRPPSSPKRVPRPPEPKLAPSPLGHDPRRRKPWGSGVFSTPEGKTFTKGHALLQYRIDRDGYPVLTTDGRPLHSLIDEAGRDILDEEGKPIDTVVDVPPGALMRAYPRD